MKGSHCSRVRADYLLAFTTTPTEHQRGEKTMTKKDYELIAAAIRRTGRPECNGGMSLPDREINHAHRIAQHIADELGRANPRFEKSRFLTACGFPPKY
jgi:hypothetical protein